MEMRDPALEPQEVSKDQSLKQDAPQSEATSCCATDNNSEENGVCGCDKSQSSNESAQPDAAVQQHLVDDDDDLSAEADAENLVSEAELDEDSEAVRAIRLLSTSAEVLDAARAIEAREASEISRDEVSRLKQQFINVSKASVEAARAKWLEEGNAEEDFVAPANDDEEAFKAIINSIKEKKAAYISQQEAIRLANMEKKNAIIDEIVALAEDMDNVNRTFARYRELQDEFNAIGEAPATEETKLWKRFQEAREQYSDNLKINKELRDYDFKKNLEAKEELIAEAAKLNDVSDIISAFKQLQDLHAKWREIGPVAKEKREEIWAQFKEASAEVNKRYQTFFEERKAREVENEKGKTAICERVEALDFSNLKSFNAWEQMTKEIIGAQEDWKKLGFASRKMNNALFSRFRATCDTFFAAKAAYFKNVKDTMAANLARKTELAERAEALSESTAWKKTSDELIAMQKEWKTIGTVAKKHSDAVWNRFQAACDKFFENKKNANSDTRQTEQANLAAKRALISRLDEITAETPKMEAQTLISDLQKEWQEIGHVPFREKDKVYEAFRTKINEIRKQFRLNDRREHSQKFEESISRIEGDENKLYRERERQARLLETRRAELRTYQNNLGFLNAKSKSGNSLVKDFESKIERLKEDIASLEEKIKLIDSKMEG
jgi:DNA repair exonuclease SbcCD ATPase subunit